MLSVYWAMARIDWASPISLNFAINGALKYSGKRMKSLL